MISSKHHTKNKHTNQPTSTIYPSFGRLTLTNHTSLPGDVPQHTQDAHNNWPAPPSRSQVMLTACEPPSPVWLYRLAGCPSKATRSVSQPRTSQPASQPDRQVEGRVQKDPYLSCVATDIKPLRAAQAKPSRCGLGPLPSIHVSIRLGRVANCCHLPTTSVVPRTSLFHVQPVCSMYNQPASTLVQVSLCPVLGPTSLSFFMPR